MYVSDLDPTAIGERWQATSSPTQDLFDSQDFENAGIGHGNITSFKLILQMLGVMLHLRRGNLGSLRKDFRYFRWMQHYRTN